MSANLNLQKEMSAQKFVIADGRSCFEGVMYPTEARKINGTNCSASASVTIGNKVMQSKPIEANYFKRKLLIDRSRFKRCCNNFVAGLFASSSLFFSAGSFSACANEAPVEHKKLPWGVFPISNDIKWVETYYCYDPGFISHYPTIYSDTITYTLRQVNENQAELYSFTKKTKTIPNWEPWMLDKDSAWEVGPKLEGLIIVENQKVYFQIGTSKMLYYDYSLKEGEEFKSDDLSNYQLFICGRGFYVGSIDSVLIGNENIGYEYRKKYNFTNSDSYFKERYSFSVIDGIGCDIHFFYLLYLPVIGQDTDPLYYRKLEAVYYKDKIVFKNSYKGNYSE